jgi:hypothetical protein
MPEEFSFWGEPLVHEEVRTSKNRIDVTRYDSNYFSSQEAN